VSVKVVRKVRNSTRSLFLQGSLFLLLLLVAIYFFINSSFFSVRAITINGTKELQKEIVLDLAGTSVGENLIKLDIGQIKAQVELSSMVEFCTVERKFPDQLIINIQERQAAALVSYRDGFILLDKQGYYIRLVNRLTDYNYPLINGAQLPIDLVPGTKVDGKGLKEALNLVSHVPPGKLLTFTEIHIKPDNNLELYTEDGIRVLVGDSSNIGRKLQWFFEIYRQLLEGTNKSNIEYVDLSFDGSPIVKYR